MRILKRLKAKLLGQKPIDHDELLRIYMHAAKEMKPAPQFATDFVRLVEAHHGIVAKHTVEPIKYD
jgi:hypothetical protein|tara:strand:- start:351 stop:548 length:198 start_codon:yes stop_codon:yes gene_type:complete